jgi:hypothetical protein
MQESQTRIHDAKQKAAQEQTVFDQGQLDRTNRDAAEYNAKMNAGWTAIDHPAKDGEQFGFANVKEAEEAANSFASHLLRPGDFDTQVVYNPTSGLYVPMSKPKDYEDKQVVRFAKTDKNGDPMKDSNGKYISDGTKGIDGKVMPPTMMTGRQFETWQKDTIDANDKRASASEKWAMTGKLIEDQKKDKAIANMESHYADAQGDPFAVNLKDGTWIMSDGDRSKQANLAYHNLAAEKAVIASAEKELNEASTDDERKQARGILDQASQMADSFQGQLAKLNGKISKPAGLANAYIREYSDENGFDRKKALDQFDKAVKADTYKVSMSSEDLVRARQSLEALPKDPTAQRAIGLFQNTPRNQIAGHIADAVGKGALSKDQGDQLYKYYGLTPPPPPATPKPAAPQTPSPAGAQTIKNVAGAVKSVATGETPVPTSVIP